MSLSSYNYEKYALAGLRGARSLYNMYNATRPVVGSPLTRVQNQVNLLRRTVARQAPQISNFYWGPFTFTTPATSGYHATTVNITNDFTSSTDFDAQVIGDRFLNVSNLMRFDADITFTKFRVIFYWAKKAGNSTSIATFVDSLDPAAFTVIFDRTYYPTKNGGTCPAIRLNLKRIQTIYNKSSDVLERGDLKCRIIVDNPTAAARSISVQNRLFIQNK